MHMADGTSKPGMKNLPQPASKPRTTMSVTEMGRMLGLCKVEAYWLVKKDNFDIILHNEKMRVDIASFEAWYANQIKYKKVDGPPPGAELKKRSYSIMELAEMLNVSDDTIYTIIKRDKLETILVDYWTRVPKKAFQKWYKSQNHYRTREDALRDRDLIEDSWSLPEIRKMLGIKHRNILYGIVSSEKNAKVFETIIVGDQKRITKESFQRWYEGQTKYRIVSDGHEEKEEPVPIKQKAEKPLSKTSDLRSPKNSSYYTVAEIEGFYGIPRRTLLNWLKNGTVEGACIGNKWRIYRLEFDIWFKSQYRRREG